MGIESILFMKLRNIQQINKCENYSHSKKNHTKSEKISKNINNPRTLHRQILRDQSIENFMKFSWSWTL